MLEFLEENPHSMEIQLVLLTSYSTRYNSYRSTPWLIPHGYAADDDDDGEFDMVSFADDVDSVPSFDRLKHWRQRYPEHVPPPSKALLDHIYALSRIRETALRLMEPQHETRFFHALVKNDGGLTSDRFGGYGCYSVFTVGGRGRSRRATAFDPDGANYVLKGCPVNDVPSYLLGTRSFKTETTMTLSAALTQAPAYGCWKDNSFGEDLKVVLVFHVPDDMARQKPLSRKARPHYLLVLSKTSRKALDGSSALGKRKPLFSPSNNDHRPAASSAARSADINKPPRPTRVHR